MPPAPQADCAGRGLQHGALPGLVSHHSFSLGAFEEGSARPPLLPSPPVGFSARGREIQGAEGHLPHPPVGPVAGGFVAERSAQGFGSGTI